MADPRKEAFATTSKTIIKNLERAGMEGFFCETSADARELVKSLVPEGSNIAWGGTETFKETGVKEMLEAGAYAMLDRAKAATPEEQRAVYLQHFDSDFFFMSANALTLKGELVNIDGNSNRVACLSFGPKHVVVLVGMNKIVKDVEEGLKRVRTMRARRMRPACTRARRAKRWEYAAIATSRAAYAAIPSSRATAATLAASR